MDQRKTRIRFVGNRRRNRHIIPSIPRQSPWGVQSAHWVSAYTGHRKKKKKRALLRWFWLPIQTEVKWDHQHSSTSSRTISYILPYNGRYCILYKSYKSAPHICWWSFVAGHIPATFQVVSARNINGHRTTDHPSSATPLLGLQTLPRISSCAPEKAWRHVITVPKRP